MINPRIEIHKISDVLSDNASDTNILKVAEKYIGIRGNNFKLTNEEMVFIDFSGHLDVGRDIPVTDEVLELIRSLTLLGKEVIVIDSCLDIKRWRYIDDVMSSNGYEPIPHPERDVYSLDYISTKSPYYALVRIGTGKPEIIKISKSWDDISEYKRCCVNNIHTYTTGMHIIECDDIDINTAYLNFHIHGPLFRLKYPRDTVRRILTYFTAENNYVWKPEYNVNATPLSYIEEERYATKYKKCDKIIYEDNDNIVILVKAKDVSEANTNAINLILSEEFGEFVQDIRDTTYEESKLYILIDTTLGGYNVLRFSSDKKTLEQYAQTIGVRNTRDAENLIIKEIDSIDEGLLDSHPKDALYKVCYDTPSDKIIQYMHYPYIVRYYDEEELIKKYGPIETMYMYESENSCINILTRAESSESALVKSQHIVTTDDFKKYLEAVKNNGNQIKT